MVRDMPGWTQARPTHRSRQLRSRSAGDLSDHAEVLELPRVLAVEVLGEQRRPAFERGPVAVLADDRAEIGHADFEVALEVEFVGFDDAALRVLERQMMPESTGAQTWIEVALL